MDKYLARCPYCTRRFTMWNSRRNLWVVLFARGMRIGLHLAREHGVRGSAVTVAIAEMVGRTALE